MRKAFRTSRLSSQEYSNSFSINNCDKMIVRHILYELIEFYEWKVCAFTGDYFVCIQY